LAIILEVRTSAFWWAFSVIIIVAFAAGLVALTLNWSGGRSAPRGRPTLPPPP
jgi:hypothetical protein